MTKVGIIDYGLGNIRSVSNALSLLDIDHRLISKPSELDKADRLILPGVGAFGSAMEKLSRHGFVEPLQKQVLGKGKYFLGICIGMQLLASRSFEFGEHRGLDFIKGEVVPLRDSIELPLPHIQWAPVDFVSADSEHSGNYFYFVHSFHFVPENQAAILCKATYGIQFVAGLKQDNMYAYQFHPEKSQAAGLALLKDFCALS